MADYPLNDNDRDYSAWVPGVESGAFASFLRGRIGWTFEVHVNVVGDGAGRHADDLFVFPKRDDPAENPAFEERLLALIAEFTP